MRRAARGRLQPAPITEGVEIETHAHAIMRRGSKVEVEDRPLIERRPPMLRHEKMPARLLRLSIVHHARRRKLLPIRQRPRARLRARRHVFEILRVYGDPLGLRQGRGRKNADEPNLQIHLLVHPHHFAADEALAFVTDVNVPDGGALGRGGTVDLLAVDF